MTASLRQRRLLLVAGISIGVLALDRFVITPLFAHWQSANAEITTLRRQLQSGQGSLAIVSRFLHAIESSPLALRMDSVELTSRDERGQKISAAFVVSGLRLKPLETRP